MLLTTTKDISAYLGGGCRQKFTDQRDCLAAVLLYELNANVFVLDSVAEQEAGQLFDA